MTQTSDTDSQLPISVSYSNVNHHTPVLIGFVFIDTIKKIQFKGSVVECQLSLSNLR